jgi:hypothetical protein
MASNYVKKLIGTNWYLEKDGLLLKGGFKDEEAIDKWLMFFDAADGHITPVARPNEMLALARQVESLRASMNRESNTLEECSAQNKLFNRMLTELLTIIFKKDGDRYHD